jgi:hypothetical protein
MIPIYTKMENEAPTTGIITRRTETRNGKGAGRFLVEATRTENAEKRNAVLARCHETLCWIHDSSF